MPWLCTARAVLSKEHRNLTFPILIVIGWLPGLSAGVMDLLSGSDCKPSCT